MEEKIEKKSFKSKVIEDICKMAFNFREMFSIVFILIGIYYLIASLGQSNITIIWLKNVVATELQLFSVGLGSLILGLILNKNFIKMIKNAFV